MLITESHDGTERTWRPPLKLRLVQVVCVGLLLALPGAVLALALLMIQVPDGGWIALAVTVAAWGLLAWRFLIISVVMTPDALVIRNFLATVEVPLAYVTGVGFRRSLLAVTSYGGPACPRLEVRARAVSVGTSYWTGLPCKADGIAEAITRAVGLSPPPPRRQIISRHWAWVMLLAAAVIFGAGLYCGPLQGGHGGLPLAVREVGAALYGVGSAMLGLAFRVIRDYGRSGTSRACR